VFYYYQKMAEEKLKDYALLEHSLDNMKAEIQKLLHKIGPRDIKAAAMEESGVRATQEQDDIEIACKIADLKRARVETQKEIQRINVNLNYISRELGHENYGKLLRLWYIGKRINDDSGEWDYVKLQPADVGEELGDSERNVYRYRAEALRNFAKAYYGVRGR
jgi:hypothetical protein